MLGFVAGIMIPGASESSTDLTHAVQQEMATAFGQACPEPKAGDAISWKGGSALVNRARWKRYGLMFNPMAPPR